LDCSCCNLSQAFTPSSNRDVTSHSLSTTQYRVNDCEVSSKKSTSSMLTYVVTYCIPTAVPPRTSKVTSTSCLIQPHFITAHTSTDRIHELSLTVNSLCCKPIVTPAEKKFYIQYIANMRHQNHRSYATSQPQPQLLQLFRACRMSFSASRVYKCTLISVSWGCWV